MSRIGVRLDTGPQFTPGDLLELAMLAEDREYDTIWLPEGASDATVQLTAFATATRRIKLGTGILSVFTRTPTLLAMSAGGVDTISHGRFILGLGVGHQRPVESDHGIPFRRPTTRLRETVEIVRLLLRGERVTYQGRVFNLQGASLGFTPVRPDLPIYLAALGPRMIELAGEIADGVILVWASPSYLQRAIEHLHRGAERAGRNPEDIDVACYLTTAVVDDPEEALPAFRREIARYFTMPFYMSYFTQTGFGEEAAAVAQALGRGDVGTAAAAVSEAMVNELAIFGSADHCRGEVEARRSLGLKQPVITPFAVTDDVIGSFRTTIATFSG